MNTEEDPRIFALLDDGCNKTCHSKDWRIKTDVKLKNMKLTRIMLMRQPRGGLPDDNIIYDSTDHSNDDYLLAQVPIYGTGDAGRGWWKKLKTVITNTGMKQNRFLPAMYHLTIDGEPQVMMTTRVDDLLWGETDKGAEVMKKGSQDNKILMQ